MKRPMLRKCCYVYGLLQCVVLTPTEWKVWMCYFPQSQAVLLSLLLRLYLKYRKQFQIILKMFLLQSVFVGPWPHGMARPQVADREDGLQIWGVAANILNKQSRTTSGVVLQLGGLVEGLTTPHRKKQIVTNPLDIGLPPVQFLAGLYWNSIHCPGSREKGAWTLLCPALSWL